MRNVQVMLPPLGRAAMVLDLLHKEEPEVLAHEITNTTGTWLLVGAPHAKKLSPELPLSVS